MLSPLSLKEWASLLYPIGCYTYAQAANAQKEVVNIYTKMLRPSKNIMGAMLK